MTGIYSTIVVLHGVAGIAALVLFWTAAIARKGSGPHRFAGRGFVWSMLAICASAIPMAGVIAVRDPATGVFLSYLVVITGSSVWLGRRAINWQGSERQFRGRAYTGVAALNLAAGALTLATGLAIGNLLLAGFSLVGISLGAGLVRRRRRPLGSRNWKLREHYGAMVGSGAATHVAFFALGLRRLMEAAGWQLPQPVLLLGWSMPVVVAVIAGMWLDRRYSPRPAN